MIGYDNEGIYVAACGQPCRSWAEGRRHEQHCWQCGELGAQVEFYEENDADDRGICYEDD